MSSIRNLAGMLALGTALLVPSLALAGGNLRIAMTTADIPTTTGMPSQGGEGMRFAGYPVFEPLVAWDLRNNKDTRAGVTAGLAESWDVDQADTRRWTFQLRKGVKFHDGSDWNADVAIWNLERFFDETSAQFEVASAGIARGRVSQLDTWEKIDDDTIVITTKAPSSSFPQALTQLPMASKAKFQALGNDWAAYSKEPAGTGPFQITRVVPRQSITMVRNDSYWDKEHIAKLDRITLIPMPDANTRLAALRSGQVDWIEVPPPDAIPGLKSAGFTISQKTYPHIWPYIFSFEEGSPFMDKRVRQAANYAVNRDGLVHLMNGTVRAAAGFVPPEDPAFGTPVEKYAYNPDKAKALLAEAGYGPEKPVKLKLLISASGSGQLLPVQMNQLIQQNLKAVGFDVEIAMQEWGQLTTTFRQQLGAEQRQGANAINMSLSFPGPAEWYRWFYGENTPPTGSNWGYWKNSDFDKIMDQIQTTFDPNAQNALLAKAHEVMVDDAPWVFIVHDLNPRALSPKVKGFEPAQSWYQDFTDITMN